MHRLGAQTAAVAQKAADSSQSHTRNRTKYARVREANTQSRHIAIRIVRYQKRHRVYLSCA